MGLTNVMEWLTVACDATFGREDILLYELHLSVLTIVPGATWWLIIINTHGRFAKALLPLNRRLSMEPFEAVFVKNSSG